MDKNLVVIVCSPNRSCQLYGKADPGDKEIIEQACASQVPSCIEIEMDRMFVLLTTSSGGHIYFVPKKGQT